MRKILFWFFSMFLFLTLPAVAQHSHGGGGGHSGGGHSGGGRSSGGNHNGGNRGGERQHNNVQRGGHENRGHEARGESRNHWNGRRFDHDYFFGHWGREHRFFWGRCNWWGPRFYVGSYFWYNDAYFVIVEPIPADWYDDEVYVDEPYDNGVYYLVNPLYPSMMVRLGVRF